MPAKVIAFYNFKGGVGKTSNVVNIGTILAFHHQRKVLIVDLDSQCSSSYWLLDPQSLSALMDQPALTAYQIFADCNPERPTHKFLFEQAIINNVVKENGRFPLVRNLDLLPGSFDLLVVDNLLNNHKRKDICLKEALDPIRSFYDYILLDCPPDFHTVARNAILFSDYIVVPYIPDYLSLRGFKFLISMLAKLEMYGEKQRKVVAFVINRTATNVNIYENAYQQLMQLIYDYRKKGEVHQRTKILGRIRSDVKVGECSDYHKPILLYDGKCNASQDYKKTTQEFLQHFEDLL